MAPWTMFTKVLGGRDAEDRPPALAPDVEPGRSVVARDTLEGIGQQSEEVRERINGLALRLDDLKSLADDFGQIVQPITAVVSQHIHIQGKLLETEALLNREREALTGTRAELNELQASSTRNVGELAAAAAELKSGQIRLRDQDSQISQLRLRVDDQSVLGESLDRQIGAETARARALSDDNQVLRAEVDSLEQQRSRTDGDLSEARERMTFTVTENGRLQQLVESLSHRMSGLKGQIVDLEPQLQAGRQELAMMQTRLSTEQLARQKAEAMRETDRSTQESEAASLTMKIDGLAAQATSTERMLSHLRDQFRDKAEALRLAEKSLKDALAEKVAGDRRLDVLQDAAARHLVQVGETQRLNGDLKDRCEMLAKALGAREAQLDGSARKVAHLTDRIDQMGARFEQERAAFETANRRLIEELQSEKAERSLAQGALDIARSSRTKLLTQYTALKRQHSVGAARPLDLGQEDEGVPRSEGTDNVRPFKSGE